MRCCDHRTGMPRPAWLGRPRGIHHACRRGQDSGCGRGDGHASSSGVSGLVVGGRVVGVDRRAAGVDPVADHLGRPGGGDAAGVHRRVCAGLRRSSVAAGAGDAGGDAGRVAGAGGAARLPRGPGVPAGWGAAMLAGHGGNAGRVLVAGGAGRAPCAGSGAGRGGRAGTGDVDACRARHVRGGVAERWLGLAGNRDVAAAGGAGGVSAPRAGGCSSLSTRCRSTCTRTRRGC